MVKYIQNGAAVHSLNDADSVPAGWSVISQASAQAANPQLFGTADPVVTKVQRAWALDAHGNPYVKDGKSDSKAAPAAYAVD